MKHNKNNKLKHTVKFIRVLNQPATWIEVDVIESAQTASKKYFKQPEVIKHVSH
jgi:hypothetical protein